MALREAVAHYKKTLGVNNEQLSIETGIPKSTIDKITAGTTIDPKLSTLTALASFFGCAIDELSDARIEEIPAEAGARDWDKYDIIAEIQGLTDEDKQTILADIRLLKMRRETQ